MRVTKDSTDVSVLLYIADDSDGTPEIGVAYNTSGIDLKYRRDGAAATSITEATLASLTTAHTDGGFLEIGNGWYRLDVPDAAFATGVDKVLVYGTVTGMIVYGVTVELEEATPTAAANADAVWDEAASGHNTGGSFGKFIRQMKEGLVSEESAINDLSATTTSFVTDLTETTDDHYADVSIVFIDGNLIGQSRPIQSYNGTTKAITLDEALTEAPADGDAFIIKTDHVHPVSQIQNGLATSSALSSLDTKIGTPSDTSIAQDIANDSAMLDTLATSSALATVDSNVDAILVDTGTTIPAQITALNNVSVSDILTTQMTESYASDGTAPTLAQALFNLQQTLGDFSITGTTITVKKLDGSTTAMTYTLDDATTPTSRTRAT